MTPATGTKRAQLQAFIERVLAPEPAVQGVVAIGSVASGHPRPDSDIDAAVFLDPMDHYIVPAEAIWRPADDTFHSIFSDDHALHEEGIQLDFLRLDWQEWNEPDFDWLEGYRAELAAGWIAFDRSGAVARLIDSRTTYPEELRLARLDEAIVGLDQHLGNDGPQKRWDHLGPVLAFDRLRAAYDYLAQALFAYNRRWRIWRNREMTALLSLPWRPGDFADRVLFAANAPSLDHDGYLIQSTMLQTLFHELLAELVECGDYSTTPIDQAFIRSHEEPGRAWNMETWNKFRAARRLST